MAQISKSDLEYLVSRYIEVFKRLEPGLVPQEHRFVKDHPWERRQAFEVAWLFMNAALMGFGKKRADSIELYYIARGLALAHGAAPDDIQIPEVTVVYNPKKPS